MRLNLKRVSYGYAIAATGLAGVVAAAVVVDSWRLWAVGVMAIALVSAVSYAGGRRGRHTARDEHSLKTAAAPHPYLSKICSEDADKRHFSRSRPWIPRQRMTDSPAQHVRQASARLCLFGGPIVYVNQVPVRLKHGRRAQTLLTVLALAEGPVARGDLLREVLPDRSQDSRRNYLNTITNETRANLSAAAGRDKRDFIVYDSASGQYSLGPYIHTDLEAFDDAEQDAALASSDTEQMRHLECAVSLYVDDITPDMATPHVVQLRAQYRAAAYRACSALAHYYAEIEDQRLADYFRIRASTLSHHGDHPTSLTMA